MKTTKPPNILWITWEDTSPRFGCYGDKLVRTPYVDKLASQGIRYTHAFSTAAVCAPSRVAVITGCYATAIGAHHMRTSHVNEATPELPTPYEAVVPHYVKALPEYLRATGYYCTNNSKTDYQFESPFTAWDECGTDAHWRNRPAGKPFFAVFNLGETHESGMWTTKEKPSVTDPHKVKLPPYLPDTPKARKALARHYDNLEIVDQRLGKILHELEEDGLANDTIVFTWSDHGEGLPRAKRWPYHAGTHVPLIVRWPGKLPAGKVCEDLVSMIDLGPTLFSLLGLSVPQHMHGIPFLGPKAEKRKFVFATRDRHDESYDMVRSIREKRYQYIRNYHPEKSYMDWISYRNQHPIQQEMWRLYAEGKLDPVQSLMFASGRPAEELYDLEKDPHEIKNLAEDPKHKARLKKMRVELDEWIKAYDRFGKIPESEMMLQMWPGGIQPQTAVPIFIPIHPGSHGLVPQDGGATRNPTVIQIHSATQGASIAYRLNADNKTPWQLYTVPLILGKGATRIEAKACRIGYKDSEPKMVVFTVV